MHLKRLLAGVFVAVVFSTPALAGMENSLRYRLLKSDSVDSLYTMSERSTLLTSKNPGILAGELEGYCTLNGEVMKALDPDASPDRLAVKCGHIFEAKALEGKFVNKLPVFIVKTSTYEPFAFKNPSFPPFEQLSAPMNEGRIPGFYSSLDMYQYMGALCRKNGGTPVPVVTNRVGKKARLTEVAEDTAFDYIFNSGDGRDPWLLECNGPKKFLLEKTYRFGPGDSEFYYHSGRGLEGVNYVKLGAGKTASLEPGVMLNSTASAEFAEFLNSNGLGSYADKFKDKARD